MDQFCVDQSKGDIWSEGLYSWVFKFVRESRLIKRRQTDSKAELPEA